MKREVAPRFWPIPRKRFHWVVKPSPGPHPMERCIPLVLIVRDILGFAKTRREAKRIISEGKILVDGKVRRDERFPAGLMDVISIPEIGVSYRILPYKKGLYLHQIEGEEVNFKLCRVEGKTTVDGGHIELNLHDGRNVLIRVKDPRNPVEDVYRVFDVLKIGFRNGQEVLGHLRFDEGKFAIIIGGKNIGEYGRIISVERREGVKRERSLVTIEDENGNSYQTTLNYIFVIGDEKPLISLPRLEVA